MYNLTKTKEGFILVNYPEYQINFSSLSDEDCKTIGYVNLSKLTIRAWNSFKEEDATTMRDTAERYFKYGFTNGFQASQELNDKKYSEEQMRNCWAMAMGDGGFRKCFLSVDKYINSLSQNTWEVEIEMEQVNNKAGSSYSEETIFKPKITNNKIKILKII